MAFKPKNYASKNPTGDRSFNRITKLVGLKGQTVSGPANSADEEIGEEPSGGPVTPTRRNRRGTGQPPTKYDTATNTFRK